MSALSNKVNRLAHVNATSKIHRTKSDKTFTAVNYVFWVAILVIVLYPMYFIVISSFSDPLAVMRGEVNFWPVDASLIGYTSMFAFSHFWRSYFNSVVYTVSGTMLSVIITLMGGYALSNQFAGKKIVTFLIIFQMFFSGGLIPTFLLMNTIGLNQNPLIIVLMGAVSVWNLMITRTFMQTNIPRELFEASQLDGASHISFFVKVVLPLSGTIAAVLCVFFAVSNWNNWFTALVYVRDRNWHPVALVLRNILTRLTLDATTAMEMHPHAEDVSEAMRVAEVIKYCAIVLSTAPIVALYLSMQNFFLKGVMVGSLKG